MIKEILIIALIYYWIAVGNAAGVIKTKQCKKGREADVKSVIEEVSIEPCLGGGWGSCELYKGTNATITVKFTPSETPLLASACKLKSKLSWVSKLEMDFGDISINACDYMTCPLEANTENVFSAQFHVSKRWPTGSFPLKLKVQERGGPRRVFLCQLFKVWLTDQPTENVLS